MPEGKKVEGMFANIAKRYDVANRILSFGIDRYWRYRLLKRVKELKPGVVLDLATGSGDIAFSLWSELGKTAGIIGMDFCEPMLREARVKSAKMGSDIEFRYGDCMALPLRDGEVDVVTIGFGVRNFEDRGKGLREIHRVLKKPVGRLFILEFSQPYYLLRPFYYFYLKYILPWVASGITGDKKAYEYLGGSIERFPAVEELSKELIDVGYSEVKYYRLTGGIVAIHEATV